VSNLERDQGEPQSQTLDDVSAVLGLDSASFGAYLAGNGPIEEFLSRSVVMRLMEIIKRAREGDAKGGRDIADSYLRYVQTKGWRSASPYDTTTLDRQRDRLMEMLSDHLDPLASPADEEVIRTFRDFGWASEDSLLRRTSTPSKTTPNTEYLGTHIRDLIRQVLQRIDELETDVSGLDSDLRNFQRLPIRVQGVLTHGDVIDADVTKPVGDGDISFVTMVIRGRGDSRSVTPDQRRQMINALHVWHIALKTSAIVHNIRQEQGCIPPQEIEARIREAFEVSVNHPAPDANRETNL
jgi:hypothetical protein